MAKTPKPVIPEPRANEFDVESEWHYARSIWHENEGRITYASLEMHRARYHQEKEDREMLEARFPSRFRRELKPGSAANSVGMNRDPELAHHQAHGDAVLIAKVFYGRARARSPFKEEMPIWKNLSQGSQEILVNDAKEAIRVLDERRAARKAKDAQ